MSEPLLNCAQLAQAIGRCAHYVTGLKRAGYRFQYEAIGRTTLSHALAFIAAYPDLRATDYLVKDWKALPRFEASPSCRPGEAVCK